MPTTHCVRLLLCLPLVTSPASGLTEAQEGDPAPRRVVAPDGKEYPLHPAALEGPATFRSPFLTPDGREILVGRSADGRSYLVDLTRVEDAATEQGRRPIFSPGRQLMVGCAEFPTLRETGLHAAAELAAVQGITGRSLAELQRDAAPGQLSTAGFLAPGEELIGILQADNETVRALRLTHAELARPLFHLWNLNLRIMDQHPLPPKEQRISTLVYQGQDVRVQAASTRGFQVSLFQDEIVGNAELQIARDLTDAGRAFLWEYYPHLSAAARETMEQRLTRLHTGEMVAFYISRYGFYEGHTDYRAEPVALAWIFGLRTLPQIEKALPGGLPRLLVEAWPD